MTTFEILIGILILLVVFITYSTITREDKTVPWWEHVMSITGGSFNP